MVMKTRGNLTFEHSAKILFFLGLEGIRINVPKKKKKKNTLLLGDKASLAPLPSGNIYIKKSKGVGGKEGRRKKKSCPNYTIPQIVTQRYPSLKLQCFPGRYIYPHTQCIWKCSHTSRHSLNENIHHLIHTRCKQCSSLQKVAKKKIQQ